MTQISAELGWKIDSISPVFWDFLDRLVANSRLVIDRPTGSAHPHYPSLIYPMDYGYLEETVTIDGGGLDVFRGSLADPVLDALALTVDLEKRDAEIKLLLGCTPAEEQVVLDFLNGYSMRACLLRREDHSGE
jgi:inorganic pyrophosphatase